MTPETWQLVFLISAVAGLIVLLSGLFWRRPSVAAMKAQADSLAGYLQELNPAEFSAQIRAMQAGHQTELEELHNRLPEAVGLERAQLKARIAELEQHRDELIDADKAWSDLHQLLEAQGGARSGGLGGVEGLVPALEGLSRLIPPLAVPAQQEPPRDEPGR